MFEPTLNDNKVVTALVKLLEVLTQLGEAALKKIEEDDRVGRK